jgi:hypothetical protein
MRPIRISNGDVDSPAPEGWCRPGPRPDLLRLLRQAQWFIEDQPKIIRVAHDECDTRRYGVSNTDLAAKVAAQHSIGIDSARDQLAVVEQAY